MDLVFTVCILLWVGSVWSLLKRRDIDSTQRMMWLVIVLLAPVFGALAYILSGPKPRLPEAEEACPKPGAQGRIIDVKAVPLDEHKEDGTKL